MKFAIIFLCLFFFSFHTNCVESKPLIGDLIGGVVDGLADAGKEILCVADQVGSLITNQNSTCNENDNGGNDDTTNNNDNESTTASAAAR
ncbi:unnamed protein product [Tenebrio molitor]|jgi:hypothetical protein|nr:unnamed protein product [Tenebrio molitor]